MYVSELLKLNHCCWKDDLYTVNCRVFLGIHGVDPLYAGGTPLDPLHYDN